MFTFLLGALVAVAVMGHWEDLIKVFKKALNYLVEVFLIAFITLLDVTEFICSYVREGIVKLTGKTYFRDIHNKYHMKITEQEISESQIPENIRKKLDKKQEVVVSEEMRPQLTV